jgi:hypothetical protein
MEWWRCDKSVYFMASSTEKSHGKLSRHAHLTAHPAIRLFSDYIRERIRIAVRKEKRDIRKKIPKIAIWLLGYLNIITALGTRQNNGLPLCKKLKLVRVRPAAHCR